MLALEDQVEGFFHVEGVDQTVLVDVRLPLERFVVGDELRTLDVFDHAHGVQQVDLAVSVEVAHRAVRKERPDGQEYDGQEERV